MNIFGLPVYENPMCVRLTDVPMRQHKRKRWMSDSYHARIQKKWNKRFGFVSEPAMYQTPNAIFCHPAKMVELRAAVRASEQKAYGYRLNNYEYNIMNAFVP